MTEHITFILVGVTIGAIGGFVAGIFFTLAVYRTYRRETVAEAHEQIVADEQKAISKVYPPSYDFRRPPNPSKWMKI